MNLPKNPFLLLKAACFCLCLFVVFSFSCNKRSGKPRVLVFSKTAGFYHESIPTGIAAIQKLGAENGFDVDTTTNSEWFIEDSLKKYSTVIFLSTTGDVLNHYQEADFERYIQAGGGYVGIHAATDTEYGWGWYGRLVGGYFASHPEQQEATINVVDKEHISTEHLPETWKRKDEWYNFKDLNPEVTQLLTIDEKSYKGGTNGNNHPMAWYHEYDGGRAFYTALGHTKESYNDPLFLKHILGGIQYAIGDNSEPDYDNAKSLRVPEEDRFVKTVLNQGSFFEPTEMAVLPNLDILVAQRRGELMMYDNESKKVKQVGFLNVYFKTNIQGVNAEEGLLGLAADPDFKENNYIYMFYSPADTSVNRLSRFTFKNDTLDTKSEKVVLQFYSQRNICCHTGGSIAFGPDNMLYVSTGDNSTPFDEPNQKYVNHGFAPLNDQPGHEQYDVRRSAGNTNDLRGKILRIKINKDGSYQIPEGNLFPANTPKTRPEIFVMGNRNPYRISVDKKTGYLYWGEVGPDSNIDSLETRGPRGYDEMNQARKAGFFGWPLFIGNNIPYRQYDYTTGKSGATFNAEKPVNNSKNNTGLTTLPPAQPAFIWYPYDASKDFPQVGTGGRTAMTGPVYYTEDFPKKSRYPDYYNGKLFIYEWIRNWVKVVTMKPNGDFDKMEPFMDNAKFHNPIDMEVGPDGLIYVLEYGSGWFSKNEDAGIARLDYISGNLPPKVGELQVENVSGQLPYTLKASIKATDPEKEELTYVWKIGNITKETKEPVLTHTFNNAGEYEISVLVKDNGDGSANSNKVTVYAGNEQPKVIINIEGNRSFYFPGKPISYDVKVTDKGAEVDLSKLVISTDYIEGSDLAGADMGHQVVSETMMGESLMLSLDCKSCHKTNETSIGPSYTKVAQRYQKDPKAFAYLSQKIIKGGSGVWGEVAMPAHPDLSEADSKQIVQWILSLTNTAGKTKSLPDKGRFIPVENAKNPKNSVFAVTATYSDQGANGVRPLSATSKLYLRSSRMNVSEFSAVSGFGSIESGGNKALTFPASQASINVSKLDLTGIKAIELNGAARGVKGSYKVEVRVDGVNGKKVGEGIISFGPDQLKSSASVSLQAVEDNKLHDLFLVSTPVSAAQKSEPVLKTVRFIAW